MELPSGHQRTPAQPSSCFHRSRKRRRDGEQMEESVDDIERGSCRYSSPEKRGKTYGHITVSGQARVQNGDMIVYGNYTTSCDRQTSAHVHCQRKLTPEQQLVLAKLAIVLTLLLTVLERGLGSLLRWMDRLPLSIIQSLPQFEDAFGNVSSIDVRFVSDWAAFDFSLCTAFGKRPGRRGLQRVLDSRYRLHDDLRIRPIDPRRRPDFSTVFVPGRRIQMSIYFDADELASGTCPKCASLQTTLPLIETTCWHCGFTYRLLDTEDVDPCPETAAEDPSPSSLKESLPRQYIQSVCNEEDRPEHFQRISIGAEMAKQDTAMPSATAVGALDGFNENTELHEPHYTQDNIAATAYFGYNGETTMNMDTQLASTYFQGSPGQDRQFQWQTSPLEYQQTDDSAVMTSPTSLQRPPAPTDLLQAGSNGLERSNSKRSKHKQERLERHEDELYHCTHPGCSHKYKLMCEVRKHFKAHHSPNEARPHGCPYCDKRFNWPKDVRRHTRQVHNTVT